MASIKHFNLKRLILCGIVVFAFAFQFVNCEIQEGDESVQSKEFEYVRDFLREKSHGFSQSNLRQGGLTKRLRKDTVTLENTSYKIKILEKRFDTLGEFRVAASGWMNDCSLQFVLYRDAAEHASSITPVFLKTDPQTDFVSMYSAFERSDKMGAKRISWPFYVSRNLVQRACSEENTKRQKGNIVFRIATKPKGVVDGIISMNCDMVSHRINNLCKPTNETVSHITEGDETIAILERIIRENEGSLHPDETEHSWSFHSYIHVIFTQKNISDFSILHNGSGGGAHGHHRNRHNKPGKHRSERISWERLGDLEHQESENKEKMLSMTFYGSENIVKYLKSGDKSGLMQEETNILKRNTDERNRLKSKHLQSDDPSEDEGDGNCHIHYVWNEELQKCVKTSALDYLKTKWEDWKVILLICQISILLVVAIALLKYCLKNRRFVSRRIKRVLG